MVIKILTVITELFFFEFNNEEKERKVTSFTKRAI